MNQKEMLDQRAGVLSERITRTLVGRLDSAHGFTPSSPPQINKLQFSANDIRRFGG
jgi:hypothetical protein